MPVHGLQFLNGTHRHDLENKTALNTEHCRRAQVLQLGFAHRRLRTSHGQDGREDACLHGSLRSHRCGAVEMTLLSPTVAIS